MLSMKKQSSLNQATREAQIVQLFLANGSLLGTPSQGAELRIPEAAQRDLSHTPPMSFLIPVLDSALSAHRFQETELNGYHKTG